MGDCYAHPPGKARVCRARNGLYYAPLNCRVTPGERPCPSFGAREPRGPLVKVKRSTELGEHWPSLRGGEGGVAPTAWPVAVDTVAGAHGVGSYLESAYREDNFGAQELAAFLAQEFPSDLLCMVTNLGL